MSMELSILSLPSFETIWLGYVRNMNIRRFCNRKVLTPKAVTAFFVHNTLRNLAFSEVKLESKVFSCDAKRMEHSFCNDMKVRTRKAKLAMISFVIVACLAIFELVII